MLLMMESDCDDLNIRSPDCGHLETRALGGKLNGSDPEQEQGLDQRQHWNDFVPRYGG